MSLLRLPNILMALGISVIFVFLLAASQLFDEALALRPANFHGLALLLFALLLGGGIVAQSLIKLRQTALALRKTKKELQDALKAIRVSNEKYLGIFENASEGIFQATPRNGGRYLSANPALARIFGYDSPEDLMANLTSIEQHLYLEPDRQAKLLELIQKGDSVSEFESVVYRKDDSVIWISENIRAVRDSQGQLIHYEGMVRDITERKVAEGALRESEERFRQVVSSISDHLYMTELTADGRPTNRYLSRNVETLTGYPISKFLTDWSFWPSTVIHPADRAIASAQFDRLVQDRSSEVEYRLVRADGDVIWVRDSARVEKEPIRQNRIVYGVVSDITERKRAEAELTRFANQLRTAADVSQQLSAILDPDQLLSQIVALLQTRFHLYHVHVYLLNEATDELIMQVGSGQVGRFLREHGHCIQLDQPQNLVAQAARDREMMAVDDIRSRPEFRANPLLAETHAEVAVPLVASSGLLGVLDVHGKEPDCFSPSDLDTFKTLAGQIAIALENARLFEQSQQTAARLREMDRLKSEFLANMSHELRTPLNSIIGYSEMMLVGMSGELADEVIKDTQAIYDNGQHLLHIICDILDLAKIEAGQLTLNLEETPMAMLIEDLKTRTSSLFANKSIDLIVEVEEQLPLIEVDPIRVNQILNNLVSNAAKFTEKGHVALRAFCENGWVCLEVEDTGVGMTEADLETIFEKFRQVDGSFTRRAQGTGLGLAITKQLVEIHGGDIDVCSQPGQGTIFTVRLPIERGQEIGDAGEEISVPVTAIIR